VEALSVREGKRFPCVYSHRQDEPSLGLAEQCRAVGFAQSVGLARSG